MKFIPEDYQITATQHILDRKVSALFVEMGLGKTAATITALDKLIIDSLSGVLVIAPLNVCLLTWPDEFQKWEQFRWMKVVSLRTAAGIQAWKDGSAHVYLVNWDYIPAFIAKGVSAMPKGWKFPVNTVVYDELSKAKSHSSIRVNTWRKYRHLFEYHIGLTGTPMPNSHMDLFAQFRLLDGGRALGTSFTRFRKEYFYPTDFMQYNWVLKPGAKERIESAIAPFVLTLRSADHMDIPPTVTQDVEVALPESAWKFYKDMQKTLLAEIRGERVEAANAAVLVNKLLQVTSGSVYDANRDTVRLHNSKLDALDTLVKKHKGESIIVVCMFKHEQERILQAFSGAEKFSPENLDRWNRGEIPIWVLDPRSAGHGINLQAGGRIIVWFSLTYSRELYDQMNARLARKGQTKDTFVYRITVPLTVDDAVAAVLQHKGDQQSALFTALNHVKTLSTIK